MKGLKPNKYKAGVLVALILLFINDWLYTREYMNYENHAFLTIGILVLNFYSLYKWINEKN